MKLQLTSALMCLAVCSATSALNARSVSILGEPKDHSKFAKEAIPAVHNVADFSGVQLTACSNFSYLNAGMHDENVAEVFKALTIPTPNGALANSKATVDMKYSYGKAGSSKAEVAIKGDVPFYVVHE
jgi:hypothetical protein